MASEISHACDDDAEPLIERLWKFFKKKTLYNHYFETVAQFKAACEAFAAEKTNLIRFSPANWKASGAFEFLGFEFRWGRGRWGQPTIKRRTARKKYRASLASFQDWCRKHCRLPKAALFAKLNAKPRGYYFSITESVGTLRVSPTFTITCAGYSFGR
jgi:hypothetical protein